LQPIIAKKKRKNRKSVLPAKHLATMKTLYLVVMLLFMFAGGGFCLGGTGGGLTGLILLNCIGLYLTGGFHKQSKLPAATLSHDLPQGLLCDEDSVG
jgi:hypothetical protein